MKDTMHHHYWRSDFAPGSVVTEFCTLDPCPYPTDRVSMTKKTEDEEK